MSRKSESSIDDTFRAIEDEVNGILEKFNSEEHLIPLDTEFCRQLKDMHDSKMTSGRLGRACLNIISELQQRCIQSEEKRMVSPWETESVALSRAAIWAQTVWASLAEALEALSQSDLEKATQRIILSANSMAAFALCMDFLEKVKDELKESGLKEP